MKRLYHVEPGNILCSGVSDEVLEERILKVGASQINVKVNVIFSCTSHSASIIGIFNVFISKVRNFSVFSCTFFGFQ